MASPIRGPLRIVSVARPAHLRSLRFEDFPHALHPGQYDRLIQRLADERAQRHLRSRVPSVPPLPTGPLLAILPHGGSSGSCCFSHPNLRIRAEESPPNFNNLPDNPIPDAALKYLARYTHRIAISNSRIVGVDEESVRFTWKDYRNGNQVRPMRLPGCEFVRRFLLHALPKGFVRIRRYGILANCQRQDRLTQCRQLLAEPPSPSLEPEATDAEGSADALQSSDAASCNERRCDACGKGWMRVVEVIPAPGRRRSRAPPTGVGS